MPTPRPPMVISVSAVVFDLDGTLFDHVASASSGARAWLASSGVELTSALEAAWFEAEERHSESWRNGEISWDEQRRQRLRDFLPLVGISAGTDSELDVLFREGYLTSYEAAWVGFEDVEQTLDELRRRGFALGMLTNGSEDQQRAKLERLGLLQSVGPVFTAEALGIAKPSPASFHLVCTALGVDPAETVYVGDDYVVDVVAARAAGLEAVYLDRTNQGPTSDPHRITSLDQLSRLLERAL